MRRLLSAVLVVLLTAPAGAAEWLYEELDVPIAYFDTGAAQFQFACRGGDFTMGYWVRSPHQLVASATSMHLAILPDPAKGAKMTSAAGARFAQDMPLIHSDGAFMVIRGPVAKAWARIAQRAKETIRVAYIRKQASLEALDVNDFSATGSQAAIKAVLDRCG